MALEPGGYADKLGNRFELRWVARQLLRLLDERLVSVCLEAVGDDQKGVDLWVQRADGTRQAQQCKVRNAGQEKWTFAAMNTLDILSAMRTQLDRSETNEFALVSPVEGKLIHDICESARASTGPETFFVHSIEAISDARRKAFRQFCGYLAIDMDTEAGRAAAFDYLRRFRVIHWEDDSESSEALDDLTRLVVAGDTGSVIPILVDFARSNLHKPLNANDVRTFLAFRNLQPRDLPHDDRILPVLETLGEQFEKSIRPGLIDDQLIPRSETRKVMEALESKGVVLVHGAAGTGKSGVVYELTRLLQDGGVPYLPVRLDRQLPEGSPLQFGKALGLPESPARCLAAVSGSSPSVLILDQLDTVRWTARHSLDSLSVCKGVVSEVVSLRSEGSPIRAVVVCRTFDLEHDPEIRAWLKGEQKTGIPRIEIGLLNENVVRGVCEQHCAQFSALSARQRDLLRRPSHLSMWTQIAASGVQPEFRTGPELMREFWSNKYSELERTGVVGKDVREVLGKLVNWMEAHSAMSAPLTIVGDYGRALEALQSHAVIAVSGRQVSFAHQGYLDYQIASKLLEDLYAKRRSVREWLGVPAQQSLFCREQLRLILSILEEESEQEFVEVIRSLLSDLSVRFHLKHLVLEVVSQFEHPCTDLLNYLCGLINDEDWRDHVLETVCAKRAVYVLWLIERGSIRQWLEENEDEQVRRAVWLLRSVADKIPDEVTHCVRPFLDRDEEAWKRRVAACLCWKAEDDTDEMFRLRLDLARSRIFVDRGSLARLVQVHPDRAVEMIGAWLSALSTSDMDPLQHAGGARAATPWSRLREWTEQEYSALLEAARCCPSLTWERLIPNIQRLCSESVQDGQDPNETWREQLRDVSDTGGVGIARGILEMAISAGKRLAETETTRYLESRTSSLRNNQSPVIQFLLAEVYSALSGEAADNAISWLIHEADRLEFIGRSGEAEWSPAARVIKQLSPACSERLFCELKAYLLHYHHPNEKDLAEYYLGSWKRGFFGDYWGRPQYFLLPALDERRRGPQVEGLIGVLRRKFAGYPSWELLNTPLSGWMHVRSTLPKSRLEAISDRAWLEDIVGNSELQFEDRRGGRPDSGGEMGESSIRHFARDLASVAKRFPSRFAALALRFPENAHEEYKAAILEGLQQTRLAEGSDEEKAQWEPAARDLTEAVMQKFLGSEEPSVARQFCWLVKARSTESWSEPILDQLARYAIGHVDPPEGGPTIGESDGTSDADNATVETLQHNSLNVVRGTAALALGAVLWHHPELLPACEDALIALSHDRHPAVRTAAISAYLPVLNIDRDKAICWFVQACREDARVSACRSAVHFFNYCMESHRAVLEPLIREMVNSTRPDVAREGAREATARWLLYGYLRDELDLCTTGTDAQREGVARVAADFVLHQQRLEASRILLESFLDDPNNRVRAQVNRAFGDKRIFSLPDVVALMERYIQTRSYTEDPGDLLYAMKDYSGSLLPYSGLILRVCETFAGPLRDDSRDISTSASAYVSMLPPLLLRLYEQAQDASNTDTEDKCLDAWDLLYEKRVGIVREMTKSLDQ